MNTQTIKTNRKENKKAFEKLFKQLEKTSQKSYDIAKEKEKSLSGAMRRLKSVHYNKENSFKLKASQLAVISNNDLDLMVENMTETDQKRWNEAEEQRFKITVGDTTRYLKKLDKEEKDKERVNDKIAELKAEYVKGIFQNTVENFEVPVESVKHEVEIDTKEHERKFTPKQALTILNRIHAQYSTYRIDGMKANNIDDVRACNGIFETVANVA